MRRLSHHYATNKETEDLTETWTPPLTPNAHMQKAQDLDTVRQFCANFGVVLKTSILSLDDDLIRLRSKDVEKQLDHCVCAIQKRVLVHSSLESFHC